MGVNGHHIQYRTHSSLHTTVFMSLAHGYCDLVSQNFNNRNKSLPRAMQLLVYADTILYLPIIGDLTYATEMRV